MAVHFQNVDVVGQTIEQRAGPTFLAERDVPLWPVADLLEARRVPFVFATGYGRAGVPERFAHRIVLNKPLALVPLRQALTEIGTIGA